MKIHRFITGIALLLSLSCSAQWRYGVKIGGDINTSALKGKGDLKGEHHSGFSGGVTFEYQIENLPWAFDGSLLYTRTGVSVCDIESDRNFRLCKNWLNVPLHVKYKFWMRSMKDLTAPYIVTGPSVFLGLGSRGDYGNLESRRVNAGWDVGVGFDAVNFVQVQAVYRFGLHNSLNGGGLYKGISMRNDGVNISVSLLFDF